jgi:molybdate transport system ATP-binding protein
VTLTARLRARLGAFDLGLDVDAADGEVVALLGPNGAGKTTALRVLAGLAPAGGSRVVVDGVTLADPVSGTDLPPDRRPVAVAFSDVRLFPHLSALDNVAFGLRARGERRRPARVRARAELDRVGLAAVAAARPAALSGGQAQRVALARALVTAPALLLLDEPLAAVDAATRATLRSDLAHSLRRRAGVTVLVTHDALDAMVLADRVVVLEGGRAVQEGAPAEVARVPRTDYVARLVGLNLYRGTVVPADDADSGPAAAGYASTAAPATVVALDGGGRLTSATAAGGRVVVTVAPAAVALHARPPGGSPRNCWTATVAAVEQHGTTLRVRLDGAPPVLADVTPAAAAELRLTVGQRVWASVKATETAVFPD